MFPVSRPPACGPGVRPVAASRHGGRSVARGGAARQGQLKGGEMRPRTRASGPAGRRGTVPRGWTRSRPDGCPRRAGGGSGHARPLAVHVPLLHARSAAGSPRPGLCERPAELRSLARGRGPSPEGGRSAGALASGGPGRNCQPGTGWPSRNRIRQSRGRPTVATRCGLTAEDRAERAVFPPRARSSWWRRVQDLLPPDGSLSHTGDEQGDS
jgi:hypothetical protein